MFERSVERLALGFVLAFLLVAAALGYWSVVAAPTLQGQAAPGRPGEEERSLRGRILDRRGRVLAETVRDGGGARRVYPVPAAAPVVGYHSARFGQAGLEAMLDAELRGEPAERGFAGAWTRLLNRPTVGADLTLTLDADLQELAVRLLAGQPGALVALDPRSGAVLALASSPTYDPNRLEIDRERLNQASDAPFFNRALQGQYVPGSTFTIVTAAAALEVGLVDPDRPHDHRADLVVDGFRIRNHHPGRTRLTWAEDFAWSCNVALAMTGLGLGATVPLDFDDTARPRPWDNPATFAASAQRFLEFTRRFGFEAAPPFDLPTAPSTLEPGLGLTRVDLASVAIGQGRLLVTPLQMALIVSAAANDGALPHPYLVASVQRPGTEPASPPRPAGSWRQAVSPATAATLKRLLVLSVEQGDAQPAAITGVVVAGKTGTAELGESLPPHAWFVGFAPADNPRIAVAVVLEQRGSRAAVAATMARTLMEAALAEPG